MDTKQLIELAKARNGIKSLTGIAEAIGINQSSLSLLKSGKSELSDETYIKLAKLAGVDPAEVLIEKHMRKAGPEGQKVWAHLAKALPKSAALLVLIVLITPYNQMHVAFSKFSMLTNNYYVK